MEPDIKQASSRPEHPEPPPLYARAGHALRAGGGKRFDPSLVELPGALSLEDGSNLSWFKSLLVATPPGPTIASCHSIWNASRPCSSRPASRTASKTPDTSSPASRPRRTRTRTAGRAWPSRSRSRRTASFSSSRPRDSMTPAAAATRAGSSRPCSTSRCGRSLCGSSTIRMTAKSAVRCRIPSRTAASRRGSFCGCSRRSPRRSIAGIR